jgi:hypothetical protein
MLMNDCEVVTMVGIHLGTIVGIRLGMMVGIRLGMMVGIRLGTMVETMVEMASALFPEAEAQKGPQQRCDSNFPWEDASGRVPVAEDEF